jgi:hypothetical protein
MFKLKLKLKFPLVIKLTQRILIIVDSGINSHTLQSSDRQSSGCKQIQAWNRGDPKRLRPIRPSSSILKINKDVQKLRNISCLQLRAAGAWERFNYFSLSHGRLVVALE